MRVLPDSQGLEQALARLERAHPELDALSALVLLALVHTDETGALSTARLSRRLEIEHALIRRACAELEGLGFVRLAPAGKASPALNVWLERQEGAAPNDLEAWSG